MDVRDGVRKDKRECIVRDKMMYISDVKLCFVVYVLYFVVFSIMVSSLHFSCLVLLGVVGGMVLWCVLMWYVCHYLAVIRAISGDTAMWMDRKE